MTMSERSEHPYPSIDQPRLFDTEDPAQITLTFRMEIHPAAGVAEYSLSWYATPADPDTKGSVTSGPLPYDTARRKLAGLTSHLEQLLDDIVPPFMV